MRKDLFELISHAKDHGVQFAVSPAVSRLLTDEVLVRLHDAGVSSISISLDGSNPATHDAIRGTKGIYGLTLERIRAAIRLGVNVQINTAIMEANVHELPQMLHIVKGLGVKIWELFFLVRTGRGSEVGDLTPAQYESACNFLFDASHHGLVVRCVEAPFIRRVASRRRSEGAYWHDEAYLSMKEELSALDGRGDSPSTLRPKGTLDGDGVVFVGHDGSIYPGGLLPVLVGNIRGGGLVSAYRQSPLLNSVRERKYNGACGACDYVHACGGSRARAYAYFGDPLASDPACLFASA